MASREGPSRPTSPPVFEDGFPQFPPGPPSIISSRMTDIASDDGKDNDGAKGAGGQRSVLASDAQSRPGTARTGMSANRLPPLRRGVSGKRASMTGSVGSIQVAGRPPSSASRTHVPSLTSHAFFHPMNAQKLQAQRGAMRPSVMVRQQQSANDDPVPKAGGSNPRQSMISNSNPVVQLARQLSEDGDIHPPPSRGTEMTEHETVDRITANTSPTYGHYAAASLSESVRPLQKKPYDRANLTINVDKGRKGANLPTPVRTPRSFRSSFLLPSRSEPGQTGFNREMEGGEKLDSVASSPQLGPKHRVPKPQPKVDGAKASTSYNFQYFEGNTVFCIGGRLQNAKHRPVNVGTGLAMVLPGVLFFIFCAPWIWYNISPAVPIIFAYVLFISGSSFLHASGSDPGILPRNLHQFPEPDPNEDPLRLGPPTNDWTLVKSTDKSVAAMEVPTKYCKTCNIWRPPRAHHCRLCDNCVETQDHHCVWLNNCIGRRNYRYFVTFLVSTTILGLYLIGACLAQILIRAKQDGAGGVAGALSETSHRVALALVIYGAIGALYPAALTVYHFFLMARGETTREYLNSHKFIKKDRYRAFTQGSWVRNWFTVLCRPRPPTYYRFKDRYAEGDQRLGGKREESKTDSKEGLEMQSVKRQGDQATVGFQGPVALRNTAAQEGA